MADPKRPRDTNQLAKMVVDIAASGAPSEENRESAERRAGQLGGAARAKKLLPQERQDIARKAAVSRWEKK